MQQEFECILEGFIDNVDKDVNCVKVYEKQEKWNHVKRLFDKTLLF